MPENVRRLGRAINTHVNVWAVAYVVGTFVMAGPAQDGFGWPFARTVVWVIGAPGFYWWGIRDGRKSRVEHVRRLERDLRNLKVVVRYVLSLPVSEHNFESARKDLRRALWEQERTTSDGSEAPGAE